MSGLDGVTVVGGDEATDIGAIPSEILVVTSEPSHPWAVCFGGLRHGFGMPTFEFVNFLRDRDVNVMFVRDSHSAWYQRGLQGLSDGLESTTRVLRGVLTDLDASDVVTVGNSAGGFAAIYFGWALGARRSLAFAPQSFLDPVRRFRHREDRWKNQTRSLYREHGRWRSSYRLESLLRPIEPRGETHVHFPASHRLDACHVAYLRDLPGVRLHPHEIDGHDMVRMLRDDGTLGAIVDEALGAAGPA